LEGPAQIELEGRCSMRANKRIGVIIPALNEEAAIGRVIADIPVWVDEIVVVDNGSSDATVSVAAAAGARVVNESRRGYGSACQTGIATLTGADIVVFLDGDYSDFPAEMARLVDPIAAGSAQLIIGSRVAGLHARGALTPHQLFGNWFACRLMSLFFGAHYTDLGPFRAIDRQALQSLQMKDPAFGWTVEMQIQALRLGLAVAEVPVSYRARIGTSKISGTVIGSLRAGYTILTTIMRAALTPAR
jgi:glycosyltransferase involved in cell wall biosynthesis